jgi:predicted CXXCH cytochrome family protein
VKQLVPILALAVALAVPAWAQQTKITNTPHNLNNYPGVTLPGNQVCLPCHVPHNAYPYNYNDPLQKKVLWNHAETQQTFTMYTTLNGHTGSGPEGYSKMCLSCHDGVTAIDSYGGATGSIVITGPANLGNDLSNDHPIGIEYPNSDPGYNAPSGFQGVKLETINGKQRVECTSCHEPHNNGLGSFLRRTLNESLICLECHNK